MQSRDDEIGEYLAERDRALQTIGDHLLPTCLYTLTFLIAALLVFF